MKDTQNASIVKINNLISSFTIEFIEGTDCFKNLYTHTYIYEFLLISRSVLLGNSCKT